MDIDFNNLFTGEDLSVDNKSDVAKQEKAELDKQYRIWSKKHAIPIITNTVVGKRAANPITQEVYNARLFTLLHIIRNPHLAEQKYPLHDTWVDKFTVEYNSKMTSLLLAPKHKERIIDLMKELGVYKRFSCKYPKDVIAVVLDFHKSQQINTLQARVTALELQMEDNGNIWYRGVEIVRQSRAFKVTVNGNTFTTRHGTFDKLLEFLKQIDERL